jgi:hypothetical protein
MNRMQSSVNPFAVVFVSAYLLVVGTWLVLRKQIPSPGFARILRCLARRPFSAPLQDIRHEGGNCFLAPLPDHLLSDQESASALKVYEDGKEIGPAHASHADIRSIGLGRFSHWGPQLYFSASDNSDPTVNRRTYSVREVRR